MKAQHRIKRASDFARLRREGRSVASRHLVLATLNDPAVGPKYLAGLITSKKVGNAVVRNRVRRQLRSIIQENSHQIAHGTMLVTIARYKAASASFQTLRREWLGLARRTKILTS